MRGNLERTTAIEAFKSFTPPPPLERRLSPFLERFHRAYNAKFAVNENGLIMNDGVFFNGNYIFWHGVLVAT